MSSCCGIPSRPGTESGGRPPDALPAGAGSGAPAAVHDDVLLPAGHFRMGDHFGEGYPDDGEAPVHDAVVAAFRIDAATVTNAQFAAFVEATGYRTESELYGSSAVFHLQVQAAPQDILGPVPAAPWWLSDRGADWAHPAGPLSSWEDIPDHPVVQASWNDAEAYCRWAGRRLPTEAEWEYAARGGLEGKRFAWGDELYGSAGEHLCNIWQGDFPRINSVEDGFLATAPVRSFPPNGFGLYEVSGNVWEWCSDWFLPKYYRTAPAENPQGPTIGRGRVMRGGSFLCHDSYCNRYRVAARSSNGPDSASSNCGFRTAA